MYTTVKEMSSVDGGDINAIVFPHSAYFIPLQSPLFSTKTSLKHMSLAKEITTITRTECLHTGCNRRNGPDFGRVFLILNYTEKPQNIYIQS